MFTITMQDAMESESPEPVWGDEHEAFTIESISDFMSDEVAAWLDTNFNEVLVVATSLNENFEVVINYQTAVNHLRVIYNPQTQYMTLAFDDILVRRFHIAHIHDIH